MDAWLQDLKFSLRVLRRTPRMSAVVVLCIALAVGLNGAVFSIVNLLLFRDLPVAEPDRLVRVYQASPGFPYASFSYPNYRDVRDRNEVFSDFASGAVTPVDVRTAEGPERLAAGIVTGTYFRALGVDAAVGRLIEPADDVSPGAHPVAVISHGNWQERFGGRPDIVGETLTVNGQTFTVIGVAPEGFRGTLLLADLDLWVPMMMERVIYPGRDRLEARGHGWMFETFGRLREGVSIEQARQGLELMTAQLAEEHPELWQDTEFTVVPLSETILTGNPEQRGMIASSSWVLMVMVGLVLLIACANIANLLLARAESRRREISIRLATGAGRWRLFRQLLTESVVLSGLGGVFGLLLAVWAGGLLPRLVPPTGLPIGIDLGLDWRVVGYTALITVATGLLFGLAPALRASRTDVVAGLHPGSGEARRPGWLGGLTLSKTLVVAQVALCVLLLVGAALFTRSLAEARTIDPGFATEGVLLASFDPALAGLDREQTLQFYRRLDEAMAGQPGVRSVAFGEVVPLGFGNSQQWGIAVEGYEPAEGERMNPDYNVVGPGYFETLDIAVLRGRGFEPSDREESEPVVVINQAMADRYWAGRDALGGIVHMGGEERRVVGIVEDIKWKGLRQEPEPYLYAPWTQIGETSMEIHVRTAGDPTALAGILRAESERLAPAVAVTNVRSMGSHAEVSLFTARTGAGFLGGFGVLALVLAAVGLYGVLSYAVSRQTRAIGIRMALGADRARVFGQTLRQGMTLTVVGLAIGIAAALALARLLQGLLYGLSATDLVSFVAAVTVLVGVALLATVLPARRATRIDPWKAIRSE